jgi:hypothetical protein
MKLWEKYILETSVIIPIHFENFKFSFPRAENI